MRIVYVAAHGSVHTRRWVRYFADQGHDVHVVTCGGADVSDRDSDGTVLPRTWRVHDLGLPRLGKVGYLFKIWRARRIVRALQPDVVHAHWVTSYGLLALCSGVRPLVVTAHGDDLLIAPRHPLKRIIVRRVLRAARLITVPSEQMHDAALALLGDTPREVIVFQYGVAVAELAALGGTRVAPKAGHALQIVSARPLLHLYRIDVLLDAIQLLIEGGMQVECTILGDGPERQRLEAHAHQAGISSRVSFLGAVPPAQVAGIMAAADCFVSVAESDGASLAVLEAMAIGLIPVLGDIPASRAWINDGQTGVLTAITPEAVAEAIRRAATMDPERIANLNRSIIAERADRDTNLHACELLIDSLTGVEWDPNPAHGSDAA